MSDYVCKRCSMTWSVSDGKTEKFEVEYCFDCYLDEFRLSKF